jgi:KUP system potassium uptake protein
MVVWFATLATLGVVNLLDEPSVLRALDPGRAVGLFVDQPRSAFFALGAVFLVVTGAEALYADMGHFGKRPIRLGWFTLVFPALVANYLGQGALLMSDPAAIDNPFYRLAPEGLVTPLIVLATAATVIASQALITGAFSLTMQAVQLGFLPRLRIDHTSPREIGQVYIGTVNYALMVACVLLVIAFGSSSNLAAAYGIAVTTTMVITTLLLYRVIRNRWTWARPFAVALVGVFLIIDVAFFSANVVKIPAGGWVPLVIAGVVFTVMVVWRNGRAKLGVQLREHEPLDVERFIGSIATHPQVRVPGTAVYLARDVGTAPAALLRNLRANEVIHETVLLVEVRSADEPRVPPAARAVVHDLGEGFHQVRLTYGFMEQPNVPAALKAIVTGGFGFDPDDAMYFIGRETVIPQGRGFRRIPAVIYGILHRNATGSSAYFQLPPDRVFEVGMQIAV